MGILCQTQVACFGILQLLRIEIGLHLICIVIKILVDLMLTSCVILTHPHLVALVSHIVLILERWIYPDLVVQHRLVLSVLDAELFALIAQVYRHLN